MTWSAFTDFGEVEQFEGLIRYADQRLTAPDGSTCLEIAAAGFADYAVISGKAAIVYDSLSALSFRVICGDGTSYSTEVEGSCEDLPIRGFAGTSPGFRSQFTADGEACSGIFGGAREGFHSVWTCNRQ